MVDLLQLFLTPVLFICLSSAYSFHPNRNDYDLFGLRVTGNDLMIAQADNLYSIFVVQFAPYADNLTQTSQRACPVAYKYSSWFVYTVALGKHQSKYRLFFVGEWAGEDAIAQLKYRTFVGALTYTGSHTDINCDNFSYSVKYVRKRFPHQEYLVMFTNPQGSIAYGYSNLFTFLYRAERNILKVYSNHSLSLSRPFLPFAIDYDGSSGVVVGLLDNGNSSSK